MLSKLSQLLCVTVNQLNGIPAHLDVTLLISVHLRSTLRYGPFLLSLSLLLPWRGEDLASLSKQDAALYTDRSCHIVTLQRKYCMQPFWGKNIV